MMPPMLSYQPLDSMDSRMDEVDSRQSQETRTTWNP